MDIKWNLRTKNSTSSTIFNLLQHLKFVAKFQHISLLSPCKCGEGRTSTNLDTGPVPLFLTRSGHRPWRYSKASTYFVKLNKYEGLHAGLSFKLHIYQNNAFLNSHLSPLLQTN